MNVLRKTLITAALLTACAGVTAAETLHHVHGIAYSSDGERILIPSHYGLAVFEDGRWSKAPGPEHDYMGFAATAEALYSSGHPAQGSGLVNPFGVIRSDDGGKTWQQLGFTGESDFHLLSAGYRSKAIYVFNPAPNSRMKSAGVYSSVNDGFSWQRHSVAGVSGTPTTLAAHPDDPDRFAFGTSEGLYLAREGRDLQRVGDGRVTALWFDIDDGSLWVGRYAQGPELSRFDAQSGKFNPIDIPVAEQDAVAYVAQNPQQPNEYAIATFRRDVFVSTDAGSSWRAIARDGLGIDDGR
ncbi:MAG: glycosyl hydrolase [Azoarcus sp.]|nr:glycosyl hydrolase [Azoarcus sp.]